jgi:heme/copper-type cytochrome/quinol oxidase subunit 2
MVGFAILVVLVAGLVLGAVAYVLREHSAKRERVDEELHETRTPTLEYVVPTGLDPAVILAALHREGYTATVDSQAAHQVVLVECPLGLEAQRDAVRAAIESADTSSSDHEVPVPTNVRFRDET